MPDESLPPPIGATPLSPEQQDLCRRLDEWHEPYGLQVKPSKMFEGAIFAIRPEYQSNPDRIAQAAHSLREILYPFQSKEEALREYGSVHVDKAFRDKIGRVYGQLSDLAHHGGKSTNLDFLNFTISDFERLLADFVRVMQQALTRQMDIHEEIEQVLSVDPTQIILDNPTA